MDAVSVRLLNGLPKDGSKISGGNVRDRLGLSTIEYGKAKKELKAEGLVELGKGRGGTIRLTEKGRDYEAPQKKSKDEALEIARAEKDARTKIQREYDGLKARVKEVGRQRHPEADEIVPKLYDRDWYVEVWTGKSATTDFIPEDLLL